MIDYNEFVTMMMAKVCSNFDHFREVWRAHAAPHPEDHILHRWILWTNHPPPSCIAPPSFRVVSLGSTLTSSKRFRGDFRDNAGLIW